MVHKNIDNINHIKMDDTDIKTIKMYIDHSDNIICPLEVEFQQLKFDKLQINPENTSLENYRDSTTQNFWNRVHEFYFRDIPFDMQCIKNNIDRLVNGTLENKKLCIEYFKITRRTMELFCNAYELYRGYSPVKFVPYLTELRNKLHKLEQTVAGIV